MFAAPSRTSVPAGADRDGRATFAHASARAAVPHHHSLTSPLSHTLALRESVRSTGGGDTIAKKQALAAMLEDNLVRKFGAAGTSMRAVIHKEVTAAVLGATRVTPDAMRELQAKIAEMVLATGASDSAPSPLVPRAAKREAKEVLGATAHRAQLASTLSSTGRSLVSGPSGEKRHSAAAKPKARAASGVTRAAAPRSSVDSTADAASRGEPGAAEFGVRTGDSAFQLGGTMSGSKSSGDLEGLRQRVLADPEPEKVLGLIDEVKAQIAKKSERDVKRIQFEEQRVALEEAEREKKERKEREKQLEAMWKSVTEETVADLATREQREAAAARHREMEQRRIREDQVHESRIRHAREMAEKRAYEAYQLKLTLAADEVKKQEAAKELEAKRALVKRQMEENLRALDRKRSTAEVRRAEERKSMEEYNAMVEAQDRAHKEALAAMYARHDRLHAIAGDKRKEQQARDAAEKERTQREFEEARERIAAAERAEAEARRRAAAVFRDELGSQVQEKSHRNDAEREAELMHAKLYQERAAAAERELKAARAEAEERRRQYRALLTQQIDAHKKLTQLRQQRDRDGVLAAVDELEEDEEVLAAVTQRLEKRAADLEASKAKSVAQAAAIREALREAGLNPDEAHLPVGAH